MPYGLTNAPAVFQSLINEVFKDVLNKYVIAYINDILIYSSSLTEHIQHIRTVLTCLLTNHLYIKAEKCEFHRSSITFLGYVISQQGVEMDQKRSKQSLAGPIPILQHPDPNLPFLVEVDASILWDRSHFPIPQEDSLVHPQESWNLWSSMGMVYFLPGWSLISDTTASAWISACLVDISSWMTAHQLKLNPSKTELLIIPDMVTLASFTHVLFTPVNLSRLREIMMCNHKLLSIKAALEEWLHWLEGAHHPIPCPH
ncbi:hypothetical protein QTP86_030622 [Hemibagrus guttatus]|nr:hypothetical protein QTP86_030622 [Hemibagrus guttatus]